MSSRSSVKLGHSLVRLSPPLSLAVSSHSENYFPEAGYPELIRLQARMTRIFPASFMTYQRHRFSEHSLALRHQGRSVPKLTNHSSIQFFLTYIHLTSHSFTVLVYTKVLIGKCRFGLEEPLPSRSCRASLRKHKGCFFKALFRLEGNQK